MALEQKTKVTEGQRLAVQPIDPFVGFKAWPRVLKILAIGLRKMPGGAETADDFGALILGNPAALGDMLADVCAQLNEAELDWLLRTHMEGSAWVDGLDFMEAMGAGKVRGGILGIYRALWFALEVNYSSFLEGLGGLMRKATASPSETSTT